MLGMMLRTRRMKDLMAKMVLAQKMARRVGARGEVESETTPPISQGRLA